MYFLAIHQIGIMERLKISTKKKYEEEIRSVRPSNFVRILLGFISITVSILYKLEFGLWISIVHIVLGFSWLLLIEKFYRVYDETPKLWYFVSSLDCLTVLFWVYLTGTAYTSTILGFVLITTLSSMDLNKKRGVFAASFSAGIYAILGLLVLLQIVPEINILSNENPSRVTMASYSLSALLLACSNWASHQALYTVYFQLNQRNIELQDAFGEITKLKIQQDGDYFLTSLLIEPLKSMYAEGPSFRIESRVKQYKKFRFREFEGELGGDFNLTSSIQLHDRNIIFFMNADAMGKSIQGAGGVLVLSSVIKAILERTNLEKSSGLDEKDWLSQVLLELNAVFQSFEGSMYVTGIFGVINESSKKVTFARLEHPDLIYFQKKTHSYQKMDSESSSKIGTPEKYRSIEFVNFVLEPGDFFLIGSDGKDDLLEQSGKKEFLEILKDGDGDFEKTWDLLVSQGESVDDLSILKIQCL